MDTRKIFYGHHQRPMFAKNRIHFDDYTFEVGKGRSGYYHF